ncbi:MAG TPA: hypothetical protein VGM90_06415 [Kofleriaceae bacterium]|jgi:hypothetical protein
MKAHVTSFTDPTGTQGFVHQGFDPSTSTYVMMDALITGLRWIPHEPPLVEGKGIPTFTMMTLRTMKMFGIGPGSLRRLIVRANHHVESVLQLAQREHNGQSLDEAVLETTAFLSLETPMIQSGHTVASVRVAGGTRAPLAELLAWHEQRAMPADVPRPDRSTAHAALLTKHHRAPSDVALFGYEIHIELAPGG